MGRGEEGWRGGEGSGMAQFVYVYSKADVSVCHVVATQ